MHNFNVPNLLTITRIVLSPCIFLLLAYEEKTWLWVGWVSLAFVFICATDFLDGYLANKWKQCTALGKCLDPIGDKLIVVLTIAALLKFHDLSGITTTAMVIVLFREILVNGVREFLGQVGKTIPVIQASRLKTMLQMIGLGIMVVGNAIDVLIPPNLYVPQITVHMIGESLFVLGALFGIYTAVVYMGIFFTALVPAKSSR